MTPGLRPLIAGNWKMNGLAADGLALARAVLGRPKVLLFDEATSHLDTVTEARIEENLAALTQTRIVIAHRLSTVRDADLIVVIDSGGVVEQGTHDQLLAFGGRYADLVAGQEPTKLSPSRSQDRPEMVGESEIHPSKRGNWG